MHIFSSSLTQSNGNDNLTLNMPWISIFCWQQQNCCRNIHLSSIPQCTQTYPYCRWTSDQPNTIYHRTRSSCTPVLNLTRKGSQPRQAGHQQEHIQSVIQQKIATRINSFGSVIFYFIQPSQRYTALLTRNYHTNNWSAHRIHPAVQSTMTSSPTGTMMKSWLHI